MKFIKKFLSSGSSSEPEPIDPVKLQEQSAFGTPDRVVEVYNSLRRAGKPIPGIVHDKMGNMCRDLGQVEAALKHYEEAALSYVSVQSWSDAERIARKVEDIWGPSGITVPILAALLEVALGRETPMEAVRSISRAEALVKSSDLESINLMVSVVRRYPLCDPRVELALSELLTAKGRTQLATETLHRALDSAQRDGNESVAREIRERLGQVETEPPAGHRGINVSGHSAVEEEPELRILPPPSRPAPMADTPPQEPFVSPMVPSAPEATPPKSGPPARSGSDIVRIESEDRRQDGQTDEEVVAELVRQLRGGLSELVPPSDVETRYELGIAFLEMKLFDEAVEEFQAVFRDARYRLRAVEGLAEALIERGDGFLAAHLLKEVLETMDAADAKTIGIQYWSARALEQSGNVAEAKPLYIQVALWDATYRDASQRVRALSGG